LKREAHLVLNRQETRTVLRIVAGRFMSAKTAASENHATAPGARVATRRRTGAQYEAVELQYVGGGMFSVLSFVSSLRAY
jgi:hypothetical protein